MEAKTHKKICTLQMDRGDEFLSKKKSSNIVTITESNNN
jgi:hypothetical protein